MGLVNLREIVRGCFQSAYLGYWVGAPFARRGYLREGLALPLVRLLGFRREGYSPRYLEIAGAWCDHERWAILAPE